MITIMTIEDHPKYKAASDLVKGLCRSLASDLTAYGFELSPAARRDGFTLRRADKARVQFDPKIEALRFNVGRTPSRPPPAALLHQGAQPDWLVVRPSGEAQAATYLRSLFDAPA